MKKNYLQNIPNEMQEYGFTKTLLVRMEEISLKHVETEIFVRKNINIMPMLKEIGKTLFDYCEIMNNRRRRIFNLSREIRVEDINDILGFEKASLFKNLDIYNDENVKNCIVFDFDGVLTDPKFSRLYNYIVDVYGKTMKIIVNSANPAVTMELIERKGLNLPHLVFANKGKRKKINKFIQLSKKYNNVFIIDDEEEYLAYGWIFGLKTFQWVHKENKIKKFSLYDYKFHKRAMNK